MYATRKAFTLTEALVYVAVFAILMIAVTSLVFWGVRSANKARAIRETLRNAERAMDVMAREIREGKSIYTPTSSDTQIAIETSQNAPDNDSVTYVDFYQCGTALCIKRENEAAALVTSDSVEVAQLRFSTIGTSTVNIDFTIAGGDTNVRLHSSISARGY